MMWKIIFGKRFGSLTREQVEEGYDERRRWTSTSSTREAEPLRVRAGDSPLKHIDDFNSLKWINLETRGENIWRRERMERNEAGH